MVRGTLRDSALNLAGSVLPVVVAIPALPRLLEMLGPERFGLLSLAWIVLGAGALLDFGIGRAVAREVARGEAPGGEGAHRAGGVLRWGSVLSVGIGAGTALLLLLLSGWLPAWLGAEPGLHIEIRRAAGLLAIGMPAVALASALRGALEGGGLFGRANLVRGGVNTATFLLPLLAVGLGGGLVWAVGASTLARWLGVAGFALALSGAGGGKGLGPETSEGTGKEAVERAGRPRPRELARFGGWVTLGSVFALLLTQADRILMARVLGVSAVGLWSPVFELLSRALLLPLAVSSALYPRLARASSEGIAGAWRPLWQGTGMAALLLGVPLLAVGLYLPALLEGWLGEGQVGMGVIEGARWLVLGVFLNGLAQFPHAALQAVGRPELPAWINGVELPFYVVGLWWALQAHGVAGAGMAWAVRAGVDALLLFGCAAWVLRRGDSPRPVPGRLAGAGVLAAALFLALPGGAVAQGAPASAIPVCDSLPNWQGLAGSAAEAARGCALLGGSRELAVFRTVGEPGGEGWLRVAPLEVGMGFNSAFPYGFQGGGVWYGKGATLRGRAGGAVVLGPLRLRLHPEWFRAANGEFPLAPVPGRGVFLNANYPYRRDEPQRFGSEPYGRLMPGESFAEVRVGPLAAGLTTAHEVWGPAQWFPALVGVSAEGVPRVFGEVAGLSAGPLGRGWLRGFVGRATASQWSPTGTPGHARVVSGILGVWQSPGAGNLEVGGGRFEHRNWPEEGLRFEDLLLPVEGLVWDYTSNTIAENGLATIFFRWRVPSAGVEIYGEWARDDWWYDFADLVAEPEHQGTTLLGLARSWSRRDTGALQSMRLEVLHARQPQDDLTRLPRWTLGSHTAILDGHTHRGHPLGTPASGRGGAFALSYGEWLPARDWHVTFRREDQAEESAINSILRARNTFGKSADVLYGLHGDGGIRWRGARIEGGIGLQLNLGRYYESDVWNVHARLGASIPLAEILKNRGVERE